MRYVRSALLLAAAATCSACFQFSTVLTVKADGSGTIEQRLLFSQSAVAQLRQFAALSGGGADFDPLSERQARDAAASLGPGVTYVSSIPIDSSEGVGRDISYTFTDINQLSLDQAPPPPGGIPAAPQGAGGRRAGHVQADTPGRRPFASVDRAAGSCRHFRRRVGHPPTRWRC